MGPQMDDKGTQAWMMANCWKVIICAEISDTYGNTENHAIKVKH